MTYSNMDCPLAPSMAGMATIEIVVRQAVAPAPAVPARRQSWFERLLGMAYRLCTPTFEVPYLQNFSSLSERLCRGAQPGRVGFELLKGQGVSTVINLRAESAQEEPQVRALGMNYLYLPMDPLAAPTHAETLAFLEAVSDPSLGRVFFHCYHGADRTGLLAACYRLAHDGWSVAEAIAEMTQHKFHHLFQQAKLAYLHEFEAFWRALPQEQRRRVLNQAPLAAAG